MSDVLERTQNVTEYGGILDFADCSDVIAKAYAAGVADGSGNRRTALYFPYRPGGYYIASSLIFDRAYGLRLIFETGGNPSDPSVDLGTRDEATYSEAQLKWIGPANEPMIEFSTACFMIQIDGLSTWGRDPATGNVASLSLSFGDWTDTYPDLVGRVQVTNTWVNGSRIGIGIGDSQNDQPDTAAYTFTNVHVRNCPDIGWYGASGNAASVTLEGCGTVGNGWDPTQDAINPDGFGLNQYWQAGDYTIITSYTASPPHSYPVTGDIYSTARALRFFGSWAEVPGVWITQTGPCEQFLIMGGRHFNASFDEDNTPVSIVHQATLTIIANETYGDVVSNPGVGGTINYLAHTFTDDPAGRPNLGKGRFTGSTVEDFGGLMGWGSRANSAQLVQGGTTRFPITTGDALTPILQAYDPLILQLMDTAYRTFVFGPTANDSGMGKFFNKDNGHERSCHNCYQVTADVYVGLKEGPAFVYFFGLPGPGDQNQDGIRRYRYDVSAAEASNETPILLGAFTPFHTPAPV